MHCRPFQIAEAARAAAAQQMEENPDIGEDEIKVDLPAPPPPRPANYHPGMPLPVIHGQGQAFVFGVPHPVPHAFNFHAPDPLADLRRGPVPVPPAAVAPPAPAAYRGWPGAAGRPGWNAPAGHPAMGHNPAVVPAHAIAGGGALNRGGIRHDPGADEAIARMNALRHREQERLEQRVAGLQVAYERMRQPQPPPPQPAPRNRRGRRY